jgi:hypothetical protein
MLNYSYTIPQNSRPQYSNANGTFIDIDVKFNEMDAVIRYTASQNDPEWPHSEEMYARAISGEFGPIAPYVEPPATPDYIAFWDALTTSTIYASIREQSFVSLPMNTLVTELIALLGDAKAGRANEAAIQQSMAAILTTGTFTAAQLTELQTALVAGHLEDIYTLA